MDLLQFMVRTMIGAMMNAVLANMRANHAIEPHQMNMHLQNMGKHLLKLGAVIAAVIFPATIMLAKPIPLTLPTYMHVILRVILAFNFVSGIAAITIGLLLRGHGRDNRGRYHRVAMIIMWVSCVAAQFAIGLLLLLSFLVSTNARQSTGIQ